ncbi:MAG: YggT family protein [Alphaproteobacteria bacterium]
MPPLLNFVTSIIDLYMWAVIISVVLSWLIAFNVVNTSNRFIYTLGDFLHRITEPALGRIRQFMPNLGGIDISPVFLILGLILLKGMLIRFWPLSF